MEIYSKRYELPAVPPDTAAQGKTAAEAKKFVKNLCKDLNYRPLSEREEPLKSALDFVKKFAEKREIDIDIIHTDIDIQVRLFCRYLLGWTGTMKDDLQKLLGMYDEMNIETDKKGKYDYIIVLKFMTHAIYKGDRRVFPKE